MVGACEWQQLNVNFMGHAFVAFKENGGGVRAIHALSRA